MKITKAPTALSSWLALAAMVSVLVSPATAGELTADANVGFASGSYDRAETTETWTVVPRIGYRTSRWSLELSVPGVWQDSSRVLPTGGMMVPRHHGDGGDGTTEGTGDESHGPGHDPGPGIPPDDGPDRFPDADEEVSGLSDPTLRLDVTLPRWLPAGFDSSVFLAAKAPIADVEDGLGTGEWDEGAGLSLWRWTGDTLVSMELGYWVLGDPAEFELHDPVVLSLVGGGRVGAGPFLFLGRLDGSSATTPGIEGPLEAGLTGVWELSATRTASLTVTAGLTEGAPDFALTAGIRVGSWGGEGRLLQP